MTLMHTELMNYISRMLGITHDEKGTSLAHLLAAFIYISRYLANFNIKFIIFRESLLGHIETVDLVFCVQKQMQLPVR